MGTNQEKGFAAVNADTIDSPGLGAHQGQYAVDGGHQDGTENTGLQGAAGDGLRFTDAEASDGVNQNNAEGKGGQCVQSVVALQEALKEAHLSVITGGLSGVDVTHGITQGSDG